MDVFYSIAVSVLFALTLYALARANRWSVLNSIAMIAGLVLFPVAVVPLLSLLFAPFYVFEHVLGVYSVALMAIAFALAKSVAARLKAE